MPIIKSAIKRAKQTITRRDRNIGIKKDIKSAVKDFHAKPSAKTLAAAQSELDTAVKKGLLKKNTVARRKSHLARVAKDAGVKLEAKKTAAKPTTSKEATAKKPATTKPAAKKAPATKKPAAKPSTTAKKPATKKAPAKKPVEKK